MSGVADAFYDGDTGDCGYGDGAAADFPPSTTMFIRVESAFAIDAHATNSGTVTFTFSIQERANPGCTGSVTWSPTPLTTTIHLPASYDWEEVDPWGSFHFERASPGPSGTRSYLYNLKAEATLTGGSPTSWNQTGCFNIGTSG